MTVEDLATQLLDATLGDDPLGASLLGIPGYDDRLPDFSAAGQDQLARRLTALAERARQTPDAGLSEPERQTLDFVRHTAGVLGDAATVPMVEWTIGDFHGAPVSAVLSTLPKTPLDTDTRTEGYRARLAGLPGLLETAAGRHAQGIGEGRLPVARLVQAAVTQLELLVEDPGVGGLRRPEAGDDGDRLIDTVVRPAVAAYRDDLFDRVLPAARPDDRPGLCWLPGGGAIYEILCRWHTSTRRGPDELHALGQEIVGRVGAEFSEIGARLWGTPEVGEIFARLRDDPALRYDSPEEMLDVARRAVRRAEEAAPRWFGLVPDQACLVAPIAESEAAGSAPAYYIPGAVDGSRQGTYYLNTSRPKERFRHLAEAVAFHEAVPGHHFQLTIALRQTALPLARRIMHDTATAEGWGLYAERLADEMGLYSDDVARLGMLSADAWRAGRLVVDTGLHHLGWTRTQAVDFLRTHTPLAHLEIDSEIDRYITYPAQALSYMVGRIELNRLRAEAVARLGGAFDVRGYHDFVLGVGSLPLTALSDAVGRWTVSLATN